MGDKKIQLIISILVLTGFLFGIYLMRKDTNFESRHSKGIKRSLYKDSLEHEIKVVDYYLRSDHIILDNNYEYFMTNKSVSGADNLKGVLMDWINPGDSIFKNANEKWFVVKRSDGKRIVVHFE